MDERLAVYLTWQELFQELPQKEEVCRVLRGLNRQSTILLLARIAMHLYLDRLRGNTKETIQLQSFLISNFWNDDVLNRAKEKFGTERLDFRRAFHLQQVLTLLKWAILNARTTGGTEPDSDKEARYELGSCMLKTSDLLLSTGMRHNIPRGRKQASPRRYLRLQLQTGASLEINNPPPIVNAVARSETIFGELLRSSPRSFDMSKRLEEQIGLSLDTYMDLTLGVLAIYLCRTQQELIADSGLAVINPGTLFGNNVPKEQADSYWGMESSSIEALAETLSANSDLEPHQDFTAFRMKPFLRLENGNLICVNPGFVQEKLEVGLFWTIVNNLQGEDRKKAFDAWGNLFESYVNQMFNAATDRSKESYFPFPEFAEKGHSHEAFDGIIVSGRFCAVIECKGGFLPNKAKYAENIDQFIASLDQKFGMGSGAGIEQLVRKISQLFGANPKERRSLKDIDLSKVDILIPVLIVQDGYVSSLLSVPWMAKAFRDSMRKKNLARNEKWTGLLVLHVEDLENLYAHVKAGKLSFIECLLNASRWGDPGEGRLFAFADILREILREAEIVKAPQDEFTKKFRETINRLSLRLFDREFDRTEERASG